MGTRFRKSKKILPGVRLNVNKGSLSLTVGPKGLRQTFSTTGKKTTTVGLPGTGISYTTTSGTKKSQTDDAPAASVSEAVAVPERSLSQKSKGTALILSILLGWAGVHRFYVGKAGTGILWFLTCGMFCVGWVVDICKIAGGKFTDGRGHIIDRPAS